MGVQIYISPKNIWGFFKNNLDRLRKEKVVVAENTDTGYTILLTEIDGDAANLIVERDETPVASSLERDDLQCAKSYRCLFYKYLLPVEESGNEKVKRAFSDYDIPDDLPPDVEEVEQDMTPEDMADIQYERDDELRFAMADCLSIIMEEGEGDGAEILNMYGEEFVDEVLDHLLLYLSSEQGIAIYRPIAEPDGHGGTRLIEYPYN